MIFHVRVVLFLNYLFYRHLLKLRAAGSRDPETKSCLSQPFGGGVGAGALVVLLWSPGFMLLLGLPLVPADLAGGNGRNLPRPGYLRIRGGAKDSGAFGASNVSSVGSFGRQDALYQWKKGTILGQTLGA